MRAAVKRSVSLLLAILLLLPCLVAADTTWTCPNCGKENDDNFCSRCGCKRPEETPALTYAVGDIVTLGRWNGEDIAWRVLEDKGDGIYVLLSVRGIDVMPYNSTRTAVTWESCSLRGWLNEDFFRTAFTADEQAAIVLSTLENPDNRTYGTAGGGVTRDHVYLLSLDEVGRYFDVDVDNGGGSADLTCMPTQAALDKGASVIGAEQVSTYGAFYRYPVMAGSCGWWLRSPGLDTDRAAVVDLVRTDRTGETVDATDICVRPVICFRTGGTAQTPASGAYKVGETVTLGSWGGEPISWQIMEDKGDGTYILLSVKALDALPFNTVEAEVTWATCSLRTWLNGTFYDTAFTAADKEKIVISHVTTPDNPASGVSGGPDTDDHVYLLSLQEMAGYFGLSVENNVRSGSLLCLPSAVAVNNGASRVTAERLAQSQADYSYPLLEGACWWWLRTPGNFEKTAMRVSGFGVAGSGISVDITDICARPVIRARLESRGGGAVPPVSAAGAYAKGDIVTVGTWGGEPIRWQILEDKGDGTYVVISVEGLDARAYHTGGEAAWETCDLRLWLNSGFLTAAFTPGEQVNIVPCGADTVTVLSLEEVSDYFGIEARDGASAEALICMPSATACANGAYAASASAVDNLQPGFDYALQQGACCWWLRRDNGAAYVNSAGAVSLGRRASLSDVCVRPVMRIHLDPAEAAAAEKPGAPADDPHAVGKTVTMGTWDGAPLEWQIIGVNADGTCVLMSVNALVPLPFYTSETTVTWEDSYLRRWLSGTFYDNAFSDTEKDTIVLSHVSTPANPKSGVNGGRDTEDRVFLLSIDELGKYFRVDNGGFGSSEALLCMPTRVAVINGATAVTKEEADGAQPGYDYPLREGTCGWWLRSPGDSGSSAAFVSGFGEVGSSNVATADICLRPVIVARLP